MIVETGIVSATNSNILSGGRLENVPSNGVLTLELEASALTAANSHSITVRTPDGQGEVPIDGQPVPANETGAVGVLSTRTKMIIALPISSGGRLSFSTVLAGTSVLAWRATFVNLQGH